MPLPRSFFAQPAEVLAPALLGCVLRRVLPDGAVLSGVIVETEAYLGVNDRASHSSGGRRTARNESMYSRPGTAYIYFTYGMHHCFNIVCGQLDEPVAVLIRALEPRAGLDRMRQFRVKARSDRDLCAGPGRLCEALAITRDLDGQDLLARAAPLTVLAPAAPNAPVEVQRGPRIGLGDVGAWKTAPLRFGIRGIAYLSAPFPPAHNPD